MDGSEQMNWQLLEAVRRDNDIETAKGLLDKGASVNTQDKVGWTYGMKACFKDSMSMVDFLLKRGAEVDKTGYGFTVLMAACYKKNKAMVDLLLKRGAEVNRTTAADFTALMVAVSVGAEEITDLLLQCNADIMMKTCEGWTVFHLAAECNKKTILKHLLASHGTHCQLTVDVEDVYGRTPLYIAAKHGCLDCVDVLLVHGANPEHKSHSDESPLDIAKRKGHTRIISMMTEAITIRTHLYACDMNTISMLKQNNDQLNKENKELKEKLSEADQESERLKSMIEQKDEELMELPRQRTSMRKDVEEEQALEALKRSVMTYGADQWYSLGIQLGYNCFQLVAIAQVVSMAEEKLHIVMSRKHAEVGTKAVTDLLLKACKFIPYPIYEAVVSDVGPHPV